MVSSDGSTASSPRLPRYVRRLELTEIGLAVVIGIASKIYYVWVIADFDFELSLTTKLVFSIHYWVSLGLLCFALHEALVWIEPKCTAAHLHFAVAALGCLGVAFAISEAIEPLITGIKWLS